MKHLTCLLVAFILTISASWWMVGCQIEETEPPQSGGLYVTMVDEFNAPITGAHIWINNRESPRITPAVLTGLPVGSTRLRVFKPGFLDTSRVIDVVANRIDSVQIQTVLAPSGSIDLTDAPTGTILLLNNIPVGAVPTSPETPTLFSSLGLGTFNVSAFLPGNATELPSKWTVELNPDNPAVLSPIFTPVQTGFNVGDLAPLFSLRSDWDTSVYRLQDFRGRVCLISFFFYNCSGCVQEFPYIASLYSDPAYEGKIQFFGIDFSDTYSTFARFREDHPTLGITFPLLHDPAQSVRFAYGITSCPTNIFVDATGRIHSIHGSISEAELKQTVDEMVGASSGSTFRFTMTDTVINYTNDTLNYDFHGTVENLLNAPRNLKYSLNPVDYPDTARQHSICVSLNCYAPVSGPIGSWSNPIDPLHADPVKCTIYAQISDWSNGFPIPVRAPLVGNYTLDIVVFAADNTTERYGYRLHLNRANSKIAIHAEPLANPLLPLLDDLSNR
jgi:peroxiredoxin